MEKPVKFKVGDQNLFGILHYPSNSFTAERRNGVVFITAGLRYRIGPYRQYVKYARKYCQAGYYVLRFDSSGIGDSEGYFNDVAEYRRNVVEDIGITDSVISFFKSETGVEHVGLFGMCGGAYNALITGAANPQTEFAILISLPVEQPDGLLPEGLGRLDRYEGWRSLSEESSKAIDDYLAFKKNVLFIFGGNDPFYHAFKTQFGEKTFCKDSNNSVFEICVVSNADHVFSQSRWQNVAVDQSLKWLNKINRLPAGG